MNIHPAYMAGLADSDGSFTISINHKDRPVPNYNAFFQIGWKHTPKSFEILTAIKNKYGGAVYLPTPSNNCFGKTPMVKYQAHSKALEALMKDIHPYILMKKKQLRLCMFLRHCTKVKYGNGRPKPENLKKYQYGLYLKIKALNTKNSGDRSKYASD